MALIAVYYILTMSVGMAAAMAYANLWGRDK